MVTKIGKWLSRHDDQTVEKYGYGATALVLFTTFALMFTLMIYGHLVIGVIELIVGLYLTAILSVVPGAIVGRRKWLRWAEEGKSSQKQ